MEREKVRANREIGTTRYKDINRQIKTHSEKLITERLKQRQREREWVRSPLTEGALETENLRKQREIERC